MASILELRQNLQDVQNDLKEANRKGVELAQNKTTQLGDLKNASDKIDELMIREALINQELERMENEGKPKTPVKDEGKSPFKSFGEFAQAVKNSAVKGRRDERLISNEATGGNEGTDSEGGYLVPPQYASGILDLVKQQTHLYGQARRVTITSNRLIENILDETSRVDPSTGSRHGGILAYWKAEADQYTAVKAKIRERTTNVEKLTAYCPVTEELLQDAPAIESLLNDLVAREFAFKVDDMILNGSGSSNVPLGILNGAALVTVAKDADQAKGTVSFDNLLNMRNALIAQCRGNARWYINQDVEPQLINLLRGSASDLFQSPVYSYPGQYGNDNGVLLGMPVTVLEQAAAPGSVGDIILMDASQYLIVERAGVTRQVSMHIRFDYDETVFKFSWRLGGRPDWDSKITPYKGTTARSPYVALAARA